MKRLLIFLLAALNSTAEPLVQTVDTLVLPNVVNTFESFQIGLQSPLDVKANLKISCGQETFGYSIVYQSYNLCGYQFSDEKVEDINALLKSLTIRTDANSKISGKFEVEYIFQLTNATSNTVVEGKVIQKVQVAEEVPVTQLVKRISFSEQVEPTIDIRVLDLGEEYMKNSNVQNLNVDTLDGPLPLWVKPEFKNNGLYFVGEVPQDFFDPLKLTFQIRDDRTLLKSKRIEIEAFFSLEANNRSLASVIIPCVILMICFFGLIFLLVKVSNENMDLPQKNQEAEKKDEGNNSTILTHSILQWNKEWKEEADYFKTTQDMTNLDLRSNDSFDFGNRSKIINQNAYKFDEESLMNEIEQFSTIVKRERPDTEVDAGSLFGDEDMILNNTK